MRQTLIVGVVLACILFVTTMAQAATASASITDSSSAAVPATCCPETCCPSATGDDTAQASAATEQPAAVPAGRVRGPVRRLLRLAGRVSVSLIRRFRG